MPPVISRGNFWILMVIASAYIAVFLNIQGFLALLPLVRQEFFISGAQAGLYASFYFLSATVLAILSGRFIDRLGSKKGMILGVALVSSMMVAHSFSPLYGIILGLAFVTGVGFSIVTPSVNKAVLELAEPSRRGFYMGIAHGGGGVGGFLGALLLPFWGEMVGWRPVLLAAGLAGLVAALFIYRFYQVKTGSGDSGAGNPAPGKPTPFFADLRFLLQHRYLLCLFIMGLLLGMNVSSIMGHYALYLHLDLGYTPALAGVGMALVHVGGFLGQPGWGLIIESGLRGNRRRGLLLLGLVAAMLALFFGFGVSPSSLPLAAVLAVSFLLGFCVIGMNAAYFTAVGELVPRQYVGMVTGMGLVFSRIAFVLAPPLFGLAADITGTYATSWVLMGCVTLLLVLAFFLLSNKYPREREVWEAPA